MKRQDIILLHGWNLSSAKLEPLKLEFEAFGYRVHSLDMPGFGEALVPQKPWHVVDYAEYIHEYILKNNIKNPVIVGHSFGGRVGLKYTQLYPSECVSLVLTGTPGFSPVPSKKLIIFMILAKVGQVVFRVPPLHLFSDWAKRWLYYIAGAREFFRAEGSMKQTFKNVVQDNLVTAMESVRVPTLLIWGEYDLMVPTSIARRMKDVMTNSELRIIPEADHGVPFKQPQIFAKYVREFLDVHM